MAGVLRRRGTADDDDEDEDEDEDGAECACVAAARGGGALEGRARLAGLCLTPARPPGAAALAAPAAPGPPLRNMFSCPRRCECLCRGRTHNMGENDPRKNVKSVYVVRRSIRIN